MIISFVVAMANNRVIGVKNRLPWHLPADLEHFKRLTQGHPVIMGSKTFESLPASQQPLPKRTNIVLTRDSAKQFKGAITTTSLAEAIQRAGTSPSGDQVFIIGGAQIFQLAIPLTNRIYLTVVDTKVANGDAFFPELDNARWREKELGRFAKDAKHQFSGRFLVFDRTNNFPIVEPRNGRSPEYKQELREILANNICPFCKEGKTANEQAILKKTPHWYLTPNAYPLRDTLYHFMITPWRHITNASDITGAEWQDFAKLRQWLTKEYNLTGEAMYVRSGEPLVTGASVAHLHWHIIVPAGPVLVSYGQYPK